MSFLPKRIVLSRKGFDGKTGGVPSPIFPDGSMLSLPIPATRSTHASPMPVPDCAQSHGDLAWNGRRLSDIVSSLRGRGSQINCVHLDPDLNPDVKIRGKERKPEWRGLFGQSGSAQRALEKLEQGDLFLFFGLFSRVIEDSGALRYASKEKPAKPNVLFGWLQIEEIEAIKSVADAVRLRTKYPWAAGHPHLQDCFQDKANTLYTGKEKLDIEESKGEMPAYGAFKYFSETLQLSETGNSGSFWVMPTWFKPKGDSRAVWASHPNGTTCWTPVYDNTGDKVLYHRVHLGPGQEFVLDCSKYPECISWALAKIRAGSQPPDLHRQGGYLTEH